jgi:membrane protein DedA with SNARE-associated domain
MPYVHAVLHLLATVGYPGLAIVLFVAALGIGAPIPVTALLLVTGALSGSPGGPRMIPIAVLAVLAIVCGHSADYAGGRLGNHLLAPRLSRTLDRLGSVRQFMASSHSAGLQALLLLLSRFLLTPLASPVSLLAGIIRVPIGLYLGLEALGTVIYVGGNLLLGHLFGPSAFGGGGLLLFWLVVVALTVLPVALLRLTPRTGMRAQPTAMMARTATADQRLRIRRSVVAVRSTSKPRGMSLS